MPSETKIKRALVKRLKQIPWLWYYCASDKYTCGIPDVLIVYKGKFIAIELKDPNKPSKTHRKLQAYVREMINRAGGYAVEMTSVEDSIKYIEGVVKDDCYLQTK